MRRTKLEGEWAAAKLRKHLIVRTCGLYARPSDPRAVNFVKTMLRLGRQRRRTADRRRPALHADVRPHLARAILFLLGHNGDPAPGKPITSPTPAKQRGANSPPRSFVRPGMKVAIRPITTAEYGTAAARPSYSVLDTSAYHRLGGPTMPDWKAALAEYFAEWRGLRNPENEKCKMQSAKCKIGFWFPRSAWEPSLPTSVSSRAARRRRERSTQSVGTGVNHYPPSTDH